MTRPLLAIALCLMMTGCGEKFEYKRGNLIHYNPSKQESLEPFVYVEGGGMAIVSNDSAVTYNSVKKAFGSTAGGYRVVDWSKPYVPTVRIYENKDES